MADTPPPSRYSIYERDRRLVVVDNWASDGMDVSPPTAGAPSAPLPVGLDRTAFDGRATLTTHALFDAKGPRVVTIDPGSAAMINAVKVAAIVCLALMVFVAFIAPYLLLLPLVLFAQPRVRRGLRTAITAWLDRASGGTS